MRLREHPSRRPRFANAYCRDEIAVCARASYLCSRAKNPFRLTFGHTRRLLPTHHSRRYGCPFPRTPRTEDGRPVSAGLLARGSSAPLRPSRRCDAHRQWHFGARLAAYSCGGSRGIGRKCPYRVPFSLTGATLQHRQEPSRTVNVAGRACRSQSDGMKFR